MRARSAVCDDIDVQGLPLLKPPYGTIAAVDLKKGEVLWEIPNGETPDEIRNHPALQGVELGRTGRAGQPPGALATETLLIVAEPGYGPTPNGERGSMLRAYDKATGRELAALQLPAPQSGSPMTYMLNGRAVPRHCRERTRLSGRADCVSSPAASLVPVERGQNAP